MRISRTAAATDGLPSNATTSCSMSCLRLFKRSIISLGSDVMFFRFVLEGNPFMAITDRGLLGSYIVCIVCIVNSVYSVYSMYSVHSVYSVYRVYRVYSVYSVYSVYIVV